MKKYIWRVLSLVLALMMIFSLMMVPASAYDEAPDTDANIEEAEDAYSFICECGGMITTSYTSWSAWIPVEETPCTHGKPFGTDLEYQRSRVVTMKCDTCGRGASTTEYDYKVECHGYSG